MLLEFSYLVFMEKIYMDVGYTRLYRRNIMTSIESFAEIYEIKYHDIELAFDVLHMMELPSH